MDKERLRLERPIRLWIDDSRQSEEAIRLIETAELPYERILASGHNVPAAQLGPKGTFFRRLSGIEALVRGLAPEAYVAWLQERSGDSGNGSKS